MPSLGTDHYELLKQTCKDCPYLVLETDGVHVRCDPPAGECQLETVERDSDGFHTVRDEGLSEP